MHNRDWNRERRWRETENDDDWDWYYYEYRYLPYGVEPGRSGDRSTSRGNVGDRERYGDRSMYGREGEYGRGSEPYSEDWVRGPYSGVGPRGYRRADDRIKDDVHERLTWHGYVDATDIQADVQDGIVTLSGEVRTRREKRMAEDAAESVSGVEDVINQIKIREQTRDMSETGMSGKNRQFRPGMEVVGRDGGHVGEVKEVRSNDFLVDRAMARDVYIPFNACQMMGGQIKLNVRADEVDNQDWEMPELFEAETTQTTRARR